MSLELQQQVLGERGAPAALVEPDLRYTDQQIPWGLTHSRTERPDPAISGEEKEGGTKYNRAEDDGQVQSSLK